MKFGSPFHRKSKSPGIPAAQRVQDLSRQGYSEPEIIRTLRTEGYAPADADTAMRTAVRQAALPGALRPREPAGYPPGPGPAPRPELAPQRDILPERPYEPAAPAPPRRDFPERLSEPQEFEEPVGPEYRPRDVGLPELPRPPAQRPQSEEEFLPPVQRKQGSGRDMEEIAEGLIEEKWTVFERDIEGLNETLKKVTSRLDTIEEAMRSFKGVKKSDVEHIRESVDSYKEHIAEISARIEAMERAVKDSLTPMMQTMRSLSDTVKSLKQKP